MQAVVLSPFLVLLGVLEATQKPTSNLVKPYVGKMIDRLEEGKSSSSSYRGRKETVKVSCKVKVVFCDCCDLHV